jgi:glycosyltransferase involved in cell wall biosynthesis
VSAKPRALFISSIGWDYVWQRHQTLASLAAADFDVIFCEVPGIRRVRWTDAGRLWNRLRVLRGGASHAPSEPPPEGVSLLKPWILPATSRLFCAFNGWQMRRLAARDPRLAAGVSLVVNYSPARTALQLIEAVPHQTLVYDCTDNFTAVEGIAARLPADERAILARADLTVVPSRALLTRHAPAARRCVLLPHGALVARFSCDPRPVPVDGRLHLLYYGNLHRLHLDAQAIETIALARPEWRITLVGPMQTAHAFPSNVQLAGQQSHRRLRDFIGQADVLLLPYVRNDYTEAVMPAKTYECLATGRPIVAAPLPELVQACAGLMDFAASPGEWVAAVERSIAADTPERRAQRIAVARENSWDARYLEFKRLIATIAPR